ncbi:predicted protein [Nematostella vectensis]|uniref:Motile sperm domain-containing protein 1 n=1 Tax=Nematostella vectensis TaxID=45351 RepID=A7SZN1_NEMVE|nr:predicted protein [Nematostella vectensis]|eukprot:XP_001622943.1 predicted protein [Nematostella vectensis]
MRSVQSSHFTDGSLPVFVFPDALTFYQDDQSSHKQVLTVYNPYEFTLKFKVLCTAPSRYLVVEAEGIIKPRCCVDIVIRHTAVKTTDPNIQDKFKLHVFKQGTNKLLGQKEVLSVLLHSKSAQQDKSTRRGSSPRRSPRKVSFHESVSYQGVDTTYTPSVWVVLLAVGCIAALMLPLEGESSSSRLPHYLFLSVNQKLIAAFILGLVTMALLLKT